MSDLQLFIIVMAVLAIALTTLLVVRAQMSRRPSPTDSVDVEGAPVPEVPGDDGAGDDPVTTDPTSRMRSRLVRTRNLLASSLADLFDAGVSDDAWDGLEEALITADVGVAAATELVAEVRQAAKADGATDAAAVQHLLAERLTQLLDEGDRTLGRNADGLTVWLVTGVNGTGKTTTIGKLAAIESREGRSVMLGAADTFRAAAAQQLEIWGQRTGSAVVTKDEGADPASVAFEAYEAAVAADADLLIIDTAGRLHNKRELMDELGKVSRVVAKQAGSIHETLLVLDATTGQNGIAQARAFLDAVNVTGIALTKLDGSSKGGIVVAVQRELGIPVKLVGLGEDIDDLAPFDPAAFVAGLLDIDD
ncbi:MAG: signal recognition particle-docking protein FtsY [Nitriliruptoraceae bacterium]